MMKLRSNSFVSYLLRPIKRCKYLLFLTLAFLFASAVHALPLNSTWEQANRAAVEGKTTEAIRLFRQLVQKSPNESKYSFNLAQMLTEAEQYSEAETYFKKAVSQSNARRIHAGYASFLLSQNRPAEALPYATRATGDKKAIGNVLLAKTYLSLHQADNCRSTLVGALARNPRNNEALELLIPILLRSHETDLAAKLLRAALQNFPEPEALYWYGMLGVAVPNVTDAPRQFERYLELYPRGKHRNDCIEHLKILKPAVDYKSRTDNHVNTYLSAPSNPMGDRVLKAGRKWIYDVRWKFLHLGNLKIETIGRTTFNGQPAWHLRYFTTSNPAIPGIDLDDVYDIFIDVDFRYTLSYVGAAKRDKRRWDFNSYAFDIKAGTFTSRAFDEDGYYYRIERDLPLDAYDGSSVLNWARRTVAKNKAGKAITVVDDEYKYSTIKPGFVAENVKVENVNRGANKFNAEINYVGIAGMTGRAMGWITTDAEALPVKAMFEIKIGSIELRLEKVEG
ncbi:MAG: tetratricopeptide repeat protein [bacterium]|nr:tetratricopeptide repeat protein [bacterium]